MKSEIILERLSGRIIELRNRLNLTQSQLAERLHVTKNYIYLIESGSKPGGKNFRHKLDALEKQSTPHMTNEDHAEYLTESKEEQISMRQQVMNEIGKRIEMIEQHNGELQKQLIEQIVARVKEYGEWCTANLENARAVAAAEHRARLDQNGNYLTNNHHRQANGKKDGGEA